MLDPLSRYMALSRPRLLLAAARHAQGIITDRTRLLRRVLDPAGPLPPAGTSQALVALLDREAAFDAARRAREATYSYALHVGALAALMDEVDLHRTRRAAPQEKASAVLPFRSATKASSASAVAGSIGGAS